MVRDRPKTGPNKGGFSSKALDYAFRLAVERISGEPLDDDEFSPWQADRGIRLEPAAKLEHEMVTGLVVESVGFISTEDGRFGASADGLIDHDGGAEYKCFIAPSKLRSTLLDGDISDVVDQCQFNMAIAGRKWWHYGLYCPALRSVNRHFTLHVVNRDDDYIDAMWADLVEFDKVVAEYVRRLREHL